MHLNSRSGYSSGDEGPPGSQGVQDHGGSGAELPGG